MRIKRIFLLGLMFAGLFTGSALGVDTDELEQALPPSAREILGDVTVTDMLEGEGVQASVTGWVKSELSEALSQSARSACIALAVTLLCSVAGAASQDGKTPEYVILAGALAILGICAGDIRGFLDQVRYALAELSDFSKALLPCVAAASAAVGKGASGAAKYAASALFLDVLMTVGTTYILPMIYAFAAVSTAQAALPSGALSGPVKLIRWGCGCLLSGLTTVFTLCLSLSGAIAGHGDKLAGSLAKSAISAALPVVGSILSDAADSYLAGAQLLRGAVGVFGLGAVLCVCLGPVLRLGLHYVLFKAAAALSEPFGEGRLSALVGNIASAYGMALGLLGSAGVMLFVSIVLGTEVLSP